MNFHWSEYCGRWSRDTRKMNDWSCTSVVVCLIFFYGGLILYFLSFFIWWWLRPQRARFELLPCLILCVVQKAEGSWILQQLDYASCTYKRLCHYIGALYYGRSWMQLSIHNALFLFTIFTKSLCGWNSQFTAAISHVHWWFLHRHSHLRL